MLHRSSGFWVFVCAALAALAPAGLAFADNVTLGAARDAAIYEESDTTSNGAGAYLFAGNTDNAETRRSLLAFDLSAIPPGSTIDGVTLTLFVSRTKAGPTPVTLHRILTDWTEGPSNPGGQEGGGDSAELDDVTWRYRSYDPDDEPGSPQWSTQGGDFVAGSSASSSVDDNGFYSWSSAAMANDVQGWLEVPSSNHGWMIRGQEAGQKTAKRFNSRHNSDNPSRPELVVTFTPPPATGACCFPGETCQNLDISDCNNQGGTFQGDLTSCATTTCVDPIGACCATASPWDCSEISEFDCNAQAGSYQGDGETCGLTECPVVLEPFVDALPVPSVGLPVAGSSGGTATYHVVMQELQQELHSDLPPITVWGYGYRPDSFDPAATYASYPGATLEARSGQPVTVRYFNDLRDTSIQPNPPLRSSHYLPVDTCPHGADDASPRTVVHLHGGHLAPEYDGYPESTFLPGEEVEVGVCSIRGNACHDDADCTEVGETCGGFVPGYVYPNRQIASTLWFHDHALGITRLNVYMGMAAFYIVRDAFEDALGLPGPAPQAGDAPGTKYYEIPLVIQDRTFKTTGQAPLTAALEYPDGWTENFFGDTVLVNGKVWPFLDVDQGKYRFRVINGSNSRPYVLHFEYESGGTQILPFDQIGTDGGLLPAPVPLSEMTLGPAERADIVLDFAALPSGTEVFLRNTAVVPFPGVIPNVMKFVVQPTAGFTAPLPATLRPIELLDPADAVRTRQFLLRKGSEPCAGQAWLIKSRSDQGVDVGELWDDITEFPQLGTTEIWEFANPSVVPHPMHMHLVMFQILNRQEFEIVDDQIVPLGSPIPPAPGEAGWKDTARAEPGQLLRVIARFEDYPGKFAYHCHILEHEDHEMMRQFWTIDGVSLSLQDGGQVSWSDVVGATGYDLVRGDLGLLRSGAGDFTAATQTCLVNGLLTTSYDDLDPAPGGGFWYLSRTRDAIGTATYDSGHSSQIDLRDGEIAASGVDCQ